MTALDVNAVAGSIGGSIRFGSLEFAVGCNGEQRAPHFSPDRIICFGNLEFMADKLSHLQLRGAGDKAQAVPTPLTVGDTIAEVNAHLGLELELKGCWGTFYALANILS
jgi:hypothetical protein